MSGTPVPWECAGGGSPVVLDAGFSWQQVFVGMTRV